MNYKNIYDILIERAKNRNVEGYTEKHHIIPKCMGGTNEKSNLVKLTAKEHILVHKLLTLIYPENLSLVYAYWAMCGLLNNQYRKERYSPSFRIYENAKKEMSKATKKRLSNFNVWTNRKHTQESRDKQSVSAKSRNITPENEATRRRGISDKMKLVKKSSQHVQNIRESKKGDKNPMFGKKGVNHHNSKPIEQLTLNNEFIQDWGNANQAAEKLELNYKAINQCLRGKTLTSGGYRWKYKLN